ncbi:autotransporter domain-containing protein [Proteus columbae]|uniref:autotransporter domain-containing protein n=1 Tax=Proteus columbae TaxID=1987580 RepID=UPI0022B7F197|nr:autotransporter domain-containing protein [Proteus columbae]
MIIDRTKLKISIIALSITLSIISLNTKANTPTIISDTDKIPFNFHLVNKDSLINNAKFFYIHGKLEQEERKNTPTFLTSKYATINIISSFNNSTIKNLINYGNGYEDLTINGLDKLNFISLSDNGRYAIFIADDIEKKRTKQLYFYDTFSKKAEPITQYNDIFFEKSDLFFTTQDGRFSLFYDYDKEHYPKIAELYDDFIPYNKIRYTVYDSKTNKTFSLNDLESSDLKTHPEKKRFDAFKLNFIEDHDLMDSKLHITSVTPNGQYIYGDILKETKYPEYNFLRSAYIYNTKNDVFFRLFYEPETGGESQINAVSNNNVFVGWFEYFDNIENEPLYTIDYSDKQKNKNRLLIRQAFFYDPINSSDDRVLLEINAYKPTNSYTHFKRNSEAKDISDDGRFIVGWSEKDIREIHHKDHAESFYLRNAFIYDRQLQGKTSAFEFLPNLANGSESEALSISGDGRVVYGIAQNNQNNQWKSVLWNVDNNSNPDKEREIAALNHFHDINKNDEKLTFNLFQNLKSKLDIANKKFTEIKETLERQLISLTDEKNNTIKQKELMEPQMKDNEFFNDNINTYEKYQDDINNYTSQITAIKTQLTHLNWTEEGKNVTFLEEQYNQAQSALIALQKIKQPASPQEPKEPEPKPQPMPPKEVEKPEPKPQSTPPKEVEKPESKPQPVPSKEVEKPKSKPQPVPPKEMEKPEPKPQSTPPKEVEKPKSKPQPVPPKEVEKPEPKPQSTPQKEVEKPKSKPQPVPSKEVEKAKSEVQIPDNAKQPVEDVLEQQAKGKTKEKETVKEDLKPSIMISKPIDIENTYKSMQIMAENSYRFMDMQQGQLRYLASATCSVGTEKACISGFAHYQNINKSNATQTGLSGAYRFDINRIPLVVGLAIDTDVYSSLPKGYQYQGYALPLIGFSLDLMPSLNAELNNNALHLSLKGAYLNRKVSIERQALANTEQGKGNAKITGYHIELQGYYPYSIADDLLLTPFAGLTFNQISRSAYSETQNAQFAAHYDALKTHSLLAKMGLSMDHLLGSSFILNTKAGLLWNLSHHQGDFRSHIDYLGQQNIDYSENKKQLKQRPFAHIGLTYQVDKHSSIGTKANWEMTTYRNHDLQFGINYTYRF